MTVVALTVTSVAILVAARRLGHSNGVAASGARAVAPTINPSPIVWATNVQLVAPSTNVVWALVSYDHLYRSTDQGNHWEQRPMPAGQVVSFVDDHEGWLLDSERSSQCDQRPAQIWHTTDAGQMWQQLDARGIAPSQCKTGMWFFDLKHGFVGAWDASHAATIYRTADGGSTWAATTLVPNPPNFQSQQGGVGYEVAWIKQFGSNLYLAAYGTPYLYRSSDGGASWQWFTKEQSNSLVMVTETRWLDLSMPGQSMESVDGGRAFGPYASDFTADEPKSTRFVFADALVGYASAASALIQRTLDGGRHWSHIATPGASASRSPAPHVSPSPIPMPSFAVLSAPSANVVWALVAGQYLFRSEDQGSTWDQRGPLPGASPPFISFAGDTTGWALFSTGGTSDCAQDGVQLWRTTDGAATWALVSVAQYGQVSPNGFDLEQCKQAVYFEDTMHGFVASGGTSNQAVVYSTSDGGVTWSASLLPYPPGNPNTFQVLWLKGFGDSVLMLVRYGTSHYVFSSSDRGRSWTIGATLPLDSQDFGSATSFAFLSPTHWLLVQGGRETTDAGKTWHSFSYSDEEAAGVSSNFVFATETVGYGTVRGDLRRTLDGGHTFVMIKNSWP